MFIVFEGIDGVGKSTQAARLVERLREDGWEVVEVRHPGQTEMGMTIREMLEKVPTAAMPYLFVADMVITEKEVIAPALARGAIVICDRYVASTYAYQVRGYEIAGVANMAREATNDRYPDITFMMQGPHQLRNDTRFERESDAFYDRVLRGYATYVMQMRESDNIHVIDGTAEDSEANAEKIYRLVSGMIEPVSSL